MKDARGSKQPAVITIAKAGKITVHDPPPKPLVFLSCVKKSQSSVNETRFSGDVEFFPLCNILNVVATDHCAKPAF